MTILVIDMNNIDFIANPEDYMLVKNLIFNVEYKPGMNTVIL
jgi:hypothetical protein